MSNTNTVNEVVSIQNQINALVAQKVSIESEIAKIKSAKQKELEEKISFLPAYFEVESPEEVLKLIKSARNMKVHGEKIVSTWGRGRGRKIPEIVSRDVISLVKSGQFKSRQIAKKMGISLSAMNTIKKRAGLVKPHKSTFASFLKVS